ncbi:Aldehyde dehydrogenase [Fusarium oxysporum f. sp. cubense]|uniref:aldehyde dehydrogenase (NAD(+)) n=1 Tax=Fusarium oxysporum f. sp. cubense TaxID=61366 RepID=A0A559LS22_FUSOC|nr:Aldehyde dehydrogenase [Fusarium oxysporum f. sp. cubense]
MPAAKTPRDIETRLFINGEFVESSDKKTFELKSPSTHQVVADVHEASESDTNAAVAAAKAAFPAWSELSPKDRGQYFKKLASLILESHHELAYLEAISMGRPVKGYFDAFAAADTFNYYAEAGAVVLGTSSLNMPGHLNFTLRQPYGVAAAIIPWNVPILFLALKAAPALMAGNTVVLKSSEKAPLTSAKVAQLVQKAGFPPGVFNIISGHGKTSGAILSSHMDVRVLSFTGSGPTGRLIQAAAAKSNLKNVILELGGKSPAIIFDDADLEKAAAETAHSIQWNSGQVCMANSRIYVHESIAEPFIESFKKKFQVIAAGDPTDEKVNHGPQADEIQYNNVRSYIEMGKTSGKRILGMDHEATPNGYLIHPTIFVETQEDARIMKEEIFGPVVNINTFKTEAEAISKANDTEFGLYAAVYSKNIDRALRVAKRLEAGTVGVNCTSPTQAKDMPFGGYKTSGVGREGTTVSLNNFLETKTVLVKLEEF